MSPTITLTDTTRIWHNRICNVLTVYLWLMLESRHRHCEKSILAIICPVLLYFWPRRGLFRVDSLRTCIDFPYFRTIEFMFQWDPAPWCSQDTWKRPPCGRPATIVPQILSWLLTSRALFPRTCKTRSHTPFSRLWAKSRRQPICKPTSAPFAGEIELGGCYESVGELLGRRLPRASNKDLSKLNKPFMIIQCWPEALLHNLHLSPPGEYRWYDSHRGRRQWRVPLWSGKATAKCNIVHTLTHLPLDKIAAIWQTTCSNAFSWMKILEFQKKFTEICSLRSNWQYIRIGSDNGLAPSRRQAIIWTNANPVHRCIYMRH